MNLYETRHGKLYAYPGDRYLGEAIALYGEYSEFEFQFLHDLAKWSAVYPVIMEIGANAGYLTIPLANHFTVHAFEPQPAVFELLRKNSFLNGNRATVYNMAISDFDGEIDCPKDEYSPYCQLGSHSMGISKDSIKVPCKTVDSTKIFPHVMKIDVEGMEIDVLRGATETIAKFRPSIYCENDRPEKSEELISYLMESRYTCYWQRPWMYNPDNYYGNPQNIYFGQCSMNMACIPIERKIPKEIIQKHGMELIKTPKNQILYDKKTGLVTFIT